MGRASRLDDVSCVICMDSLFTKRDDLDEVEAIAAPDCGESGENSYTLLLDFVISLRPSCSS